MKSSRKSSKESASRLFNRYVWLVDTIFRAGKITFEHINDKWTQSSLNDSGDELPLKTFHNHRNAVQEMFDIDIVCDRRAGYIYYIDNNEDIERGGVRSWLLNTFAINNLINESHKLKHRILFEQIPGGQQYLIRIIEAMRDGRTIDMTYKSFWRDEPSIFEIEPYCVKVFKQRWYVLARSTYDDNYAPRIYALDRILDMQDGENNFTLPKDFDAEEYFSNCYGIINDDNAGLEFVEVKVYGAQVKYFNALPLHHSQKEIETKEDYSVFKYHIKPTLDFRQELLSKGIDIEILAPKSLRDEVANIGRGMYKNNKS